MKLKHLLLIAGVGGVIWWYATKKNNPTFKSLFLKDNGKIRENWSQKDINNLISYISSVDPVKYWQDLQKFQAETGLELEDVYIPENALKRFENIFLERKIIDYKPQLKAR